MRMVCLSDTHNRHEDLRVPGGDVLVHAGDMTNRGRTARIKRFLDWMANLPHPIKVLIPGNHELGWDDPESLSRLERLCTRRGLRLLHEDSCLVDGRLFYGTAWQPRFRNWAFNRPRGQPLRRIYRRIPAETDVLLTHGPPRRILDRTRRGTRTGSAELRERVRRVRPRVHVFGHIHEARGRVRRWGVTFVNASVCERDLEPVNEPVSVDVG